MESFKLLWLAAISRALYARHAPLHTEGDSHRYYQVLAEAEFPYNTDVDLVLHANANVVVKQTLLGYSPILRFGEDGVFVAFVNHTNYPDSFDFQPIKDKVQELHLWLEAACHMGDVERLREFHGDLVDLPGAYRHLKTGERVQLVASYPTRAEVILGNVLESSQRGTLIEISHSTTSNINDALWEIRTATDGYGNGFGGLTEVESGFYVEQGGEPIKYCDAIPYGGFVLGLGCFPVPGNAWRVRGLEIEMRTDDTWVARNNVNAFKLNHDGNLVASQSSSYACELVDKLAEKMTELLSIVGDTRLGLRRPDTDTVDYVRLRHGDVLFVERGFAPWVGCDTVVGRQLLDNHR